MFSKHIFQHSPSDYLIYPPPPPPWHIERSPPASLCHLLPSSSPSSTPCWQAGQGRWPNLSVKVPSPRSSTTDTNYHTAGARPGNRMATTWSNQGTQQRGPEKAKKSERGCVPPVCLCTCFRVIQNWAKRVRDWQETRSHCVFLISVSCLFSADFQFKLEIISINLLITRVALIKDTVLTCTIISSPMIQKRRLNWKLTHLTAINMLGSLVLMTHYMTIKKKKEEVTTHIFYITLTITMICSCLSIGLDHCLGL